MEKSASQSKYADLLTVQPYVRVEPEVLTVLALHQIDASEAGAFFVETADRVRNCEPNYRYRKQKKDNVWILRDFFPGTQIMFKMTLVYQTPFMQAKYDSKKSLDEDELVKSSKDYEPRIWVNVKLVPSKLKGKVHIPYEAAQKYLMAKAANILIGDSIKPEPFVKVLVKPPRRMFPKGFYENRSNKRRSHLHNKRKDHRGDVPADGTGGV